MVSLKSHVNTLFLRNACDAIIITPHGPAFCCQEEKYGINSQGRVISRSTAQLHNILSPVQMKFHRYYR
ncbi:Sulfite reductase [NADPH] hemoprotein beta-component [Frankliniella fusca]|uniref:Sulfite reductase [NADPH] hemoprotein beta-component n=1 Tax=Frankliniella fusca TaxID=407009 RepID=A0AAE1I3J3_9NEOP|nr:Sulfite reductase [NADPH] hemoprotein beta-component [Frankliniella fusca]